MDAVAPPQAASSPAPPQRSKRKGGGVSLFVRLQIVFLVATVTMWMGTWYMISKAETAIASGRLGGSSSAFFDPDCDETMGRGDSHGRKFSAPYSNNPSRKQLLRRIRSDGELNQPYQLLTIAIDSRHSCPDLCTFVHPLLPSWVRYRQLHFEDEVDLAAKLRDDGGHVIVVARTNIINIANWAVERRKANVTNVVPTTGLFHNADERFHKGEIAGVYDKFDYVLRQYYRRDPDGRFHGYHLHALGNYTCGAHRQALPLAGGEPGPRWGVHYVPLNAHTVDVQLLHHATATYPTRLRPVNCSFIGRGDVKRSKHEREAMRTALEEGGKGMNCTVTFTGSFASGNSKFEYLNYDVSNSKIGLSPRGSAIETHRLAELLRMGSVPAIVAEDYLFTTFRSVPGIIADDWPGVVEEMKRYLAEEGEVVAENARDGGARLSRLEWLSREGTKYYADLEACMMADMDFLLRGAFRGSSPGGSLGTLVVDRDEP